MPQIRLYDASTGELSPIAHGDAIRVEIHTADLASQGLVDVASTRPFVLFSLLQRLLESEGLPAKFLFGSRGAGEVLRELELEAELESDDDDDEESAVGHRVESAQLLGEPLDEDEQESMEELSGRCVDIRFGAAREGEEEWAGGESAGRMTLSEAMRGFGHHALVFYLMGTHYSQPLGDPVVGMTSARRHIERLRHALSRLHSDRVSPEDMRHHVEAFREALATDLDTPGALVALFEWVLDAEQRGYDLGDSHLLAMLALLELSELDPPAEGETTLGTG